MTIIKSIPLTLDEEIDRLQEHMNTRLLMYSRRRKPKSRRPGWYWRMWKDYMEGRN